MQAHDVSLRREPSRTISFSKWENKYSQQTNTKPSPDAQSSLAIASGLTGCSCATHSRQRRWHRGDGRSATRWDVGRRPAGLARRLQVPSHRPPSSLCAKSSQLHIIRTEPQDKKNESSITRNVVCPHESGSSEPSCKREVRPHFSMPSGRRHTGLGEQ